MPVKDVAIVFDCGATNLRVIAMDISGNILASRTTPNNTDEDLNFPGGRIWDTEKMWQKLCEAANAVTASINPDRIAGATVTTFGVDGAFVDKEGQLLYPVISWQCQRTHPIMENIGKYMPLEELYRISGVYPYAFNTINKMIWFKENKPEVIQQAHRFLFIPSIFIQKLTGMLRNDTTMAGTSMMADLNNRKFSCDILSNLNLNESLFGILAEPGELAGTVNKQASGETGLPYGTPVFFAGHDTQFAIFGSGANLNQAVLSSGTWEILMARTHSFRATKKELSGLITTEADSRPGIFNIGQNWLGSGVLEWFSRHFYPELTGDLLYQTMISEGEAIVPGTHSLKIDPAFYQDTARSNAGVISGLTIGTTRAQVYRAFLESLSFRLRHGIESLESAGNFRAEKVICVGGGSKNKLWNQLRADVCNIPVQLIDQKETTVLGAALFVFAGCGHSDSVEHAREKIKYNSEVISPSGNSSFYNDRYQEYLELIKF